MSCSFCNVKDRILDESEKVFVIFSNPRLMPGHLLVIPKRHVEKVSELDENEKTEIFNLLVKWQEKILAKVASGCDIRQNYRPFQKECRTKVNHIHFHLQPREFKDELYSKCQIFQTDVFQDLKKDEMDGIKAKLEKAKS